MNKDTFLAWLSEMREAGLAKSDATAARLLGVHVNTMVRYKRLGTDKSTALACRALLHRLEPYS